MNCNISANYTFQSAANKIQLAFFMLIDMGYHHLHVKQNLCCVQGWELALALFALSLKISQITERLRAICSRRSLKISDGEQIALDYSKKERCR